MLPTVTIATMAILMTIELFIWLKALMPHSVFRLVSSIENSHSCSHKYSYLFAYIWPYEKSANNVWVYSRI